MTTALYRTDFPQQCRVHTLDGVTLVFNRRSGATHFLDSPAPEMLALLAEAAMDPATLTTCLCDRLGVQPDEEAEAVVEARLAELVATGLVQTD